MELKIGDNTYQLNYTFNSFKYMGDLNFAEMAQIDATPLKIVSILSTMFFGAMNYDRKKVTPMVTCDALLETYVDEGGDVIELFEGLTNMLTETGFFKSLQKGEQNPPLVEKTK